MKDTFLSKLLGRAGIEAPEATAVAEATATLQAEFDAFRTEAQSQLDQSATALTAAVQTIKDADAKIATLQAALDAAGTAQAALLAEAETKRLTARKEKIVAAVGDGKADGLMLATQGLTDEQFESVVGALAVSVDAEASTPMFREQGSTTADAPPSSLTDAAATMRALAQIMSQGQ